MITIIFGAPGKGKTALLTHLLNQYAYDHERYRKMKKEIEKLHNDGFFLKLPQNVVSANYKINFYKFRCSRQTNRIINPFRLGYKNPMVETHLNYPYEVIGIQEAQKYLNSRKSKNFPDWQSRWYEQHRHNNLDILMDVQRPGLIDVNIRELAQFIEIQDMEIQKNKFGRITGEKWHTRKFNSNFELEVYLQGGKKDTTSYEECTYTADYDIFNCYDTLNCKTKFYDGRKEENFNEATDDEMPKFFYTTELEMEKIKEKEERKNAN